ncbi:MAG TPA: hypothetical protein VHF89_21300, partial [Solirubrobacteraceae bacterium]|nr:hypothetical protein [Solirubrobacteraceae bacterium]
MIPGATPLTRGVLVALAALGAALLAAAPASAATFENNAPITINASGNATPFPSTIAVTGLDGPVTDVSVTLDDLSHTRPDDIDLSLVSPSGTRAVLMSDACGAAALGPVDLTFDDDAATGLADAGPCAAGTFDPTDHEPNAVGEPFADYPALNGFDGEVASGTWSLEVVDDAATQAGSISGGWSITITSAGTPPITISSGSQAHGAASPFPAELEVVSGERAIITDLDVLLDGLTHQDGDHVDMFLEGPGGQRAWLMSDVCPGAHKLMEWKIDDEAAAPFGGEEACAPGTFRPVNRDQGGFDFDTFPAGAPGLPGSTSLSAFDLVEPDGTWRLWIQDDEEGRAGFIADGWSLEIDTRAPAPVG